MSFKILGHYKKFTIDGVEVNAVCNRIGPDRFEAYVLEDRKIKATGRDKFDAILNLARSINGAPRPPADGYTAEQIAAIDEFGDDTGLPAIK